MPLDVWDLCVPSGLTMHTISPTLDMQSRHTAKPWNHIFTLTYRTYTFYFEDLLQNHGNAFLP